MDGIETSSHFLNVANSLLHVVEVLSCGVADFLSLPIREGVHEAMQTLVSLCDMLGHSESSPATDSEILADFVRMTFKLTSKE